MAMPVGAVFSAPLFSRMLETMAPTVFTHNAVIVVDAPRNDPDPSPSTISLPMLNGHTDWYCLVYTTIFKVSGDDGAVHFCPGCYRRPRCSAQYPCPHHCQKPPHLCLLATPKRTSFSIPPLLSVLEMMTQSVSTLDAAIVPDALLNIPALILPKGIPSLLNERTG
ncbi:uncharacterized protein ARMOST_10430 [Armillaria ostoyae]|uniref:Uncharacterized protein n=1 Tax=Armillaria ostoyae TaxID=47428 RepID=A0A284REA1_ARMOS|nr:uncharacterized protein ARMOST_10430 [Armillaria ostoyae]